MSTRWGSTFLIFQRLIDLKACVQDLGSQGSYLNESEWAEVSEMLQVLEIFMLLQFLFKSKNSLKENACLLR